MMVKTTLKICYHFDHFDCFTNYSTANLTAIVSTFTTNITITNATTTNPCVAIITS